MKKILLFYSKTGAAHLRSAEALAEHLKKIDQNLEILLIDGLASDKFHPDKTFLLFSTKLLLLYNFLYLSLNNKFGVWFLRTIVKVFWGKALERKLWEFNPDLIITTHPAISHSVFSETKIPYVVICLDLGKPHRLWFDEGADYIIVSDHIVKNYGSKFIDQAKIVALGYPLRENFKTPKSAHKISNRILILGGGAGVGNIKKQAQFLTKIFPDKKFIAVCGFNQRVENQLRAKNIPNLEVIGFSHNLPELISKSDIVLTKAGPASLVEAAILKTPIIITGWVGMQEKDNVDFIVENNLGIFCPEINKLPEAINEVYQNYQKYAHGEIELAHGSEQIARFLLGLLPKID